MECNKIKIRNFRNIEEAEVTFSDGVNILTGSNAQGKTNLLEAISFTAIGKSFRTTHEEDMIRFGAESTEISMDYTDSQRTQNITVRMMPGRRRRIEHNRVKVTRLSDVVGCFRTVLFCPEHLSLIKDGPSERRNYLDIALSQLYPIYLKSLQRYNQILKQRNQLIKKAEEDIKTFRDTIEFWSEQLAREAAIIARYRAEYCKKASVHIENCFMEMTDEAEKPTLVYEGSSHGDPESYADVERTEKAYFELLMTRHDREIGAGSTLWGIHKDDIDIMINGRSARSFASQGQQRSLALAMKLAEGEVSAEICGEKPVFLFDDVFSELDRTRRVYLSGKIKDRQVIITTCEPSGIEGGKLIGVRDGTYFDL